VLHAVTEIVKEQAKPVLQWASSDARYFRYRGIPTVQFGPAELAGIHSYDERVKVADVVEATHVYALLMHGFLREVRA
jgi:succinyl-diaminopimelate desuccinylase